MMVLLRTQDLKTWEKEKMEIKVRKKKTRPEIAVDAFLKSILVLFCFPCLPPRRFFKEVRVVDHWTLRKLDLGISPSRLPNPRPLVLVTIVDGEPPQ